MLVVAASRLHELGTRGRPIQFMPAETVEVHVDAAQLRDYVGSRINNVRKNDKQVVEMVGRFQRLHMRRQHIEQADWLTKATSPNLGTSHGWIHGPKWLEYPPELWPISDVNLDSVELPQEELRMPVVQLNQNLLKVEQGEGLAAGEEARPSPSSSSLGSTGT